MSFVHRLAEIQRNKQSVLCVGLDPDIARIPESFCPHLPDTERLVAFNEKIIEVTHPFASSYKLNFAFYERYGSEGWVALERTKTLIPDTAITIADNKRGDIGNSARFYASSVFEAMQFDACTVAPYMGSDSITPFLAYPEKAAFILARTSNPGGKELQEQEINGEPLYKVLVRQLSNQAVHYPGATGLVVGATTGAAMAEIRQLAPELPFLIPGVGAQGGDPGAVMAATYVGPGTVLVNSSRSILYASSGHDFAAAAGREAERLTKLLSPKIQE